MDFFTIDLRETSCKIYSEKVHLLTDGFVPDSDLFYIIVIGKGSFGFGTFGLG